LFVARRYGEALDAVKRIAVPDASLLAFTAACHARLGDLAAARDGLREMLSRPPPFAASDYLASLHYRHAADRQHHLDSLRLAGLEL
jgi:adenylate cyclase